MPDDPLSAPDLPPQRKTLIGITSRDVERIGIPKRLAGNLYHGVLVMGWPTFFATLALSYVVVNTVFALLYLAGGEGALVNARPGSFADAFYFSVHTLATIGYGSMAPVTTYTNVVVAVEAFVGLVVTAVATGLVFAKFARPTADVLFSEVATIQHRNGRLYLAIRVANRRDSRIVDARFTLRLQRDEVTAEGDQIRRFHEMKLDNPVSPMLYLSWTLLHPIDESSPMYGATPEALRAVNTELLVTVMGLDEVFVQTIHARHSYIVSDLRWGEQFEDVLNRVDTGVLRVDYGNFHRTRKQTPP